MKVKSPTPAEDTRSSTVPASEKTSKTQLPQPGVRTDGSGNGKQSKVENMKLGTVSNDPKQKKKGCC